jgi:hypothetical protein
MVSITEDKKKIPIEIKLTLSMQQAAALGIMINDVLKTTGARNLQICGEIHKQISEQMPKTPGQADYHMAG